MLRRIFAWILLAGFVFTIADIVFIGYKRELFTTVYIMALFAFLLLKPNSKNT